MGDGPNDGSGRPLDALAGRLNPIAAHIGTHMMKKMVNISEYIVHFNVLNFLKLFLYHLIFYFAGPLVIPLIAAVDSFGMVRNMMFYGVDIFLPALVLQYSSWLFGTICSVLIILKYYQISVFGYPVVMNTNFYGGYILQSIHDTPTDHIHQILHCCCSIRIQLRFEV